MDHHQVVVIRVASTNQWYTSGTPWNNGTRINTLSTKKSDSIPILFGSTWFKPSWYLMKYPSLAVFMSYIPIFLKFTYSRHLNPLNVHSLPRFYSLADGSLRCWKIDQHLWHPPACAASVDRRCWTWEMMCWCSWWRLLYNNLCYYVLFLILFDISICY